MTDGEPACCDDSIGEIVSSLLYVCERQEVMLRWRQPLRNWDSPFLFSYLSSQTLPWLPPPASPWLVSLLTCFISAAESRSESPVRFNHSPARGASSCCGKAGRTWREVKRISTRTGLGGGGWVECLWLHRPDVMRLAGWQAARGGGGRRGGRRGGGGRRSGGPVLIWRSIPGGLKENLEKLVEELDLFVTWQKMASIWMSTFFLFSLMSDEFTSLEPLFCSLRFELSRRARVSLRVVCSCMFHGFVVLTHLKYSFFNRIRSFFFSFFFLSASSFWVDKVYHCSFGSSPHFSAIKTRLDRMIVCDVLRDQFRVVVTFAELCCEFFFLAQLCFDLRRHPC